MEDESLKDGESQKDWEQTIRREFERSLNGEDPVENALAEAVMAEPELNDFCFIIAPKLAKRIVESNNLPTNLDVRLWSSDAVGHVSVFVTDRSHDATYLVDAAGLLNKAKPDTSPLGITKLRKGENHPLYGNPDIPQHISPSITRNTPGLGTPQLEQEMSSAPFTSLQELFD